MAQGLVPCVTMVPMVVLYDMIYTVPNPEGIFPSGILMCNILAVEIAYIIERSKTA